MDGPLFLMCPSAGWLSWLSFLARGGGTAAQALAAAAYPPTARWYDLDGIPVADLGGEVDRATGRPDGMQPCWSPAKLLNPSELEEALPPCETKLESENSTAKEHFVNWRENWLAIARQHDEDRYPFTCISENPVLLLGSGPSVAKVLPLVPELRERGYRVVAVNQVPTLLDPGLIDYYVVLSPRAERAWWDRPGMERVVKVAYVGCAPSIIEGPSAGIRWYGLLDGQPANRDAERFCGDHIPWYQTSRTVAGPALQFALSLGPAVIHLAGFDFCFPGGLRYAEKIQHAAEADLVVPDLHRRPVGTDRFLFQDALRMSVWAAFLAIEGVIVNNAGGEGLLGSFKVGALDGRDLTIPALSLST